jgi:hypothetical protein
MVEGPTTDARERLVGLLAERGVDSPDGLIGGLADEQLDGVYGAIQWWDDAQVNAYSRPGTGALVRRIRDGGMAGYRPAHERTAVDGSAGVRNSRELNRRIERLALTNGSQGGMTREDLAVMLRGEANQLGVHVLTMIDNAVGPEWDRTPQHPAFIRRAREAEHIYFARYCHFVGPGRKQHANPRQGRPMEGESEWDFAVRFWGYELPVEAMAMAEAAHRREQQRRALKRLEAAAEPGATVLAPARVPDDPDRPLSDVRPELKPLLSDGKPQVDAGVDAEDAAADPAVQVFDPTRGRLLEPEQAYGQQPTRRLSEDEWAARGVAGSDSASSDEAPEPEADVWD